MLKKSLIAIAVLAVVAPAFAGSVKVHDPWTYTKVYEQVPVCTIDVIMDVGYYINIVNQDKIKVTQDSSVGNGNPYVNYSGCSTSAVQSNFAAKLSAAATAGQAGGTWTAQVTPSLVPVGTSTITICVQGAGLDLTKLVGGAKDQKVATVTISVVPQA